MSNLIHLSQLKKGQKALITGYSKEVSTQKICDLGLVPGTEIEVTESIPFNGPMCLCLDKNRCKLAIGKKEAACILTEVL